MFFGLDTLIEDGVWRSRDNFVSSRSSCCLMESREREMRMVVFQSVNGEQWNLELPLCLLTADGCRARFLCYARVDTMLVSCRPPPGAGKFGETSYVVLSSNPATYSSFLTAVVGFTSPPVPNSPCSLALSQNRLHCSIATSLRLLWTNSPLL